VRMIRLASQPTSPPTMSHMMIDIEHLQRKSRGARC
jgi:hypothetical protein